MSKRRSLLDNWRLRSLLLFSLLLLAVFYLQYRHLFHCETISLSRFTEIAPDVYVSDKIPDDQFQPILRTIKSSQRRIVDFWGAQQGKPTIIVCATPTEYQKYCLSREGAGCSLGTFYGSAFIILNLHGINVDVISHEMCHNELFQRVGWYKTTFQIPQWFHEGLSMMLDYRFVDERDSRLRYEKYLTEWKLRTQPPAKRISLPEVESLKGFFNGDSRHVTLAYLTAATEVAYWLAIVEKPGLLAWAEAMKKENFDCYHRVESAYSSQKTSLPQHNPIRLLPRFAPSD